MIRRIKWDEIFKSSKTSRIDRGKVTKNAKKPVRCEVCYFFVLYYIREDRPDLTTNLI